MPFLSPQVLVVILAGMEDFGWELCQDCVSGLEVAVSACSWVFFYQRTSAFFFGGDSGFDGLRVTKMVTGQRSTQEEVDRRSHVRYDQAPDLGRHWTI